MQEVVVGQCEVAELPEMCFVGVSACRILHPELLWDSGRLLNPLNWSWCIPLKGETSAFDAGTSRVALVERYGGAGVGNNGGGARCGVMHGVQVKGIGRTALVGAGAPHWHAYGGARLDECLYDAIWTRIVQGALPYGAAECYAIIGTGTTLALPKPTASGRTTEQRALLLRKPKLRVAHFLPTSTFDWQAVTEPERLIPESDRVRAALLRMPSLLARALERPVDDSRACLEAFGANLLAMIDRLAHQLAVAMARRIVHGGLSLSNICLDGSWLDFGATSCVADYGPLITGGARVGAWPPNSMQASHLAAAFGQLSRAIAKYLPKQVPVVPDLSRIFNERFRVHEGHALMALTGLSDELLAQCDDSAKSALLAGMRRILDNTLTEPTKLLCHCPNHQPITPQQLSTDRLNSAMAAMACAVNEDGSVAAWRTWLPKGEQGDALFASYMRVVNSALLGFEGAARTRAISAITANALRVNSTTPWLHRENFRAAVSRAIDSGEKLAGFVDSIVNDSVCSLAPTSLIHQPLDTCFGPKSHCSLDAGLVINGERHLDARSIFAAAMQRAIPGSLPSQPRQPPSFYSDWRVDGQPPTKPTAEERLGSCMRLLGGDRRRANTPAGYAAQLLWPAIQNDRAHFFHAEDGRLVGYVLWATLGQETEARVLARRQMHLEATEWREGTSLWIVDVYCQPGRLRHVLSILRDEVFGSERRIRYLRQRAGKSITKEIARDSCSAFFRQSAQPSCHCAKPLAACVLNCTARPTMVAQAASATSLPVAA